VRSLLVAVAVCVAAPLAYAGLRPDSTARDVRAPRPHHAIHRPHRPSRPPQFVVVSFDGSGGVQLWPYWRNVARRAQAHFTFFLSGVYLLDWSRHDLYEPPRHPRGRSDIGFAATPEVVRGTLRQISAAYREGHEIGTHYNGHFCSPYEGDVGEWTARDWAQELDQFDDLVFSAHGSALPFSRDEVVGGRTPCLQGDFRVLYPLLAERGFRYDASQVAPLGRWPWRERGLWSIPLLEIPFVGHTFKVVSMDYNFFANQIGVAEPERETYLSLRRAFRASYRGNRAPLSIGSHFETWNHGAYDRAIARFVLETCRLREVRCVSFRELVDWLDLRFPRLSRYPR
jgi:peptidoglycan/xylan/chitin deacetylase (PgdA/CDA1 family)